MSEISESANAVICVECPTPIQWNTWRRSVVTRFQLYMNDNRRLKEELAVANLRAERAEKGMIDYVTLAGKQLEQAEAQRDAYRAELFLYRKLIETSAMSNVAYAALRAEIDTARAATDSTLKGKL